MSKSSKSKIKVPKRVAGVKIPKVVRKGPVLRFVNSSAGRMLIAEALTAALGVVAYKQGGDKMEKLKLGARDAEELLARNTSRLTHAFSEGVRAFRTALMEPGDEAETSAAVGDDDAEDVEAGAMAVPKKNSRRGAQSPNPA